MVGVGFETWLGAPEIDSEVVSRRVCEWTINQLAAYHGLGSPMWESQLKCVSTLRRGSLKWVECLKIINSFQTKVNDRFSLPTCFCVRELSRLGGVSFAYFPAKVKWNYHFKEIWEYNSWIKEERKNHSLSWRHSKMITTLRRILVHCTVLELSNLISFILVSRTLCRWTRSITAFKINTSIKP